MYSQAVSALATNNEEVSENVKHDLELLVENFVQLEKLWSTADKFASASTSCNRDVASTFIDVSELTDDLASNVASLDIGLSSKDTDSIMQATGDDSTDLIENSGLFCLLRSMEEDLAKSGVVLDRARRHQYDEILSSFRQLLRKHPFLLSVYT